MNLALAMRDMCAKREDSIVLAGTFDREFEEVTFGEFFKKAKRWAAYLASKGVGEGDRVAFITPKSPKQTYTFYATWWLGAIAVPISESLADMELGFIIRDAEPKIVLVDETMEEKVRANAGDFPVCRFLDADAYTGKPLEEPVVVDENNIAALIYTSGSTGMPKGVMLTHHNFCVNGQTAADAANMVESDVMVSLLPYWHSYALVVEVVLPMLKGYQVTIPKDRRDFSKNIAFYQPTVVLIVPRIADALMTGIRKKISTAAPTVQSLFEKAVYNASRIFTAGPKKKGGMLRMLTHTTFYDPIVFRKIRSRFGGKLRFFVSGGAPLDLEPQLFFKYLGVPIHQGYGLTESSPVVSTNVENNHRLGSCGPFLSWLEEENGGDWTFKDEKGELGKDLHGELLLKGDCIMKGYWRHTDESAKSLEGGWLHTGDIGYVEDGFLFLDGRQGNMIVLYGGEKLHPEHIEDAIKSTPMISEAMVIGDDCKNVYVCINVDHEVYDDMPEKEAHELLRKEIRERTAHLAPFQQPKDFLILPDFTIEEGTLTATLKIRRHKVKQMFGETIVEFLKGNNEELRGDTLNVPGSRVMESLGQSIVE